MITESRDLRRKYTWDKKGTGKSSSLGGEGSVLNQWRRKDGTKNGESTWVDRDVAMLRSEKGEQTDGGRGGRNGHTVWSFRGQEGR